MLTLPCRTDPDGQFPDPADSGGLRRAKRVCSDCPTRARTACLAEAMDGHIDHGVWGGFTPRVRAWLRAGHPARRCSLCRLWHVWDGPPKTLCPHCIHQRKGANPVAELAVAS